MGLEAKSAFARVEPGSALGGLGGHWDGLATQPSHKELARSCPGRDGQRGRSWRSLPGWGPCLWSGLGPLLSPGCACSHLLPPPKGPSSPGRGAPTHCPGQGSCPPPWCAWDHPEGPRAGLGFSSGAASLRVRLPVLQPSPGAAQAQPTLCFWEISEEKFMALKTKGNLVLIPHHAGLGFASTSGSSCRTRGTERVWGSAHHQHTLLHEPSLSESWKNFRAGQSSYSSPRSPEPQHGVPEPAQIMGCWWAEGLALLLTHREKSHTVGRGDSPQSAAWDGDTG